MNGGSTMAADGGKSEVCDAMADSLLSPIHQTKYDQAQKEWAESIVGRDWEVYWNQSACISPSTKALPMNEHQAVESSTSGPPPDHDISHAETSVAEEQTKEDEVSQTDAEEDEDDCSSAQHEEDWYEAKITAFDDGLSLFKVSFVGDDKIYQMNLTPQLVRPSTTAWIRRSKAILATNRTHSGPKTMASMLERTKEWERILPPDTSLSEDKAALVSLDHEASGDAPALPTSDPDHLRSVLLLRAVIRKQMYLRTKLFPEDKNYVDCLTECLMDLQAACQWFLDCWNVQSTVTAPRRHDQQPLATTIVYDLLQRGCSVMLLLHQIQDTSPSAVTEYRNRKRKQQSPNSQTRRSKRQRQTRSQPEPEKEPVDGCSLESVESAIYQGRDPKLPWFGDVLAERLASFQTQVSMPLMDWLQRAHFCLGECNLSKESGSHMDSNKCRPRQSDESEEPSSCGDKVGRGSYSLMVDHPSSKLNAPAPQNSRQLVSYNDILKTMALADQTPVIQHFDLSAVLATLSEKQRAIDEFMKRVLSLSNDIFRPAEDPSSAKDTICREIESLLDLADSEESAVTNVDPMVPSPSVSTREMLSIALIYRQWYLDLIHTETTRERVEYAENIAKRYLVLPRLVVSDITKAIVAEFDSLAERVKSLEQRLSQNGALFDRFLSVVQERQVQANDPCDDRSRLENGLAELNNVIDAASTTPYISVAEELLYIRRDIFEWGLRALSLLQRTSRPSYADICEAHEELARLRAGSTPSWMALIQSTRGSGKSIDDKLQQFASEDLDFYCSRIVSLLLSEYQQSRAWKQDADAIIRTLRLHGIQATGEPTLLSVSCDPPPLVELKQMDELVASYSKLRVDLDEMHQSLSSAVEESKQWSMSFSSVLMSDDKSPLELLRVLREWELQRPKGVAIEPTSSVVESIVGLLTWYSSLRDARATADHSYATILPFLNDGLEVIGEAAKSQYGTLPSWAGSDVVSRYHRFSLVKEPRGGKISVSRLKANSLSEHLLRTLIVRDRSEENMLFAMFHLLWCVGVEDFVEKRERFTLEDATQLLRSQPLLNDSACAISDPMLSARIDELRRLVDEGEKQEASTLKLLQQSTASLDVDMSQPDILSAQLNRIHELRKSLKARNDTGYLGLSEDIYVQLDLQSEIYSWVIQASLHPILLNIAFEASCGQQRHDASSMRNIQHRIPWKELASLYNCRPRLEATVSGPLADLLRTVEELYVSAFKWERHFSADPRISTDVSSDGRTGDQPIYLDAEKLAELSKDPILDKVMMPSESSLKQLSDSIATSEQLLDRLFASDSEDIETDQAERIPSNPSLAGDDGLFHVVKFTGIRRFASIKATLATAQEYGHIATTASLAIRWMCLAISWIEELHHACIHSSSLNSSSRRPGVGLTVAEGVLAKAESALLPISDEMQLTLKKYGLCVFTDEEQELSLKPLRKDATLTTTGAAAIAWCLYLLKSLKRDVQTTRKWKDTFSRITSRLSSAYNEFNARLLSPYDPVCVLEYLRLRDQLSELTATLDDLTVLPEAATIAVCRGTQQNVVNYLLTHATRDTLQKHAEATFMAPSRIVDDRIKLLDSLVQRRSLDGSSETETLFAAIDEAANFRTTLRLLLDKAFQKALLTVGASESTESKAVCAMKAWEIENSLFMAFPTSNGSDSTFEQYRDQGRVLKRALEDTDNLLLCIRVLTEDLEPDALVQMSSDELAPQRLKEDRAKAEALARQQLSLTLDAVQKADLARDAPFTVQSDEDIPEATADATMMPESLEPSIVAAAAMPSAPTPDDEWNMDKGLETAPANASPSKEKSLVSLGQLVQKASYRPPPPPQSLASLSATTSGSGATPTPPSEQLAIANDGSTHFYFEVASGSRRFSASLLVERDPENASQGLLTPRLAEVARVPADEFQKFLSTKLSSGRNQALVLRLETNSTADQLEYLRFCQMYDEKGRIAMFNLTNSNAKMYLVTPRFQKTIRKHIPFAKTTSPYAVIIARRVDIVG